MLTAEVELNPYASISRRERGRETERERERGRERVEQ